MDQKHIRIVSYFTFYVFNLINQYEVTYSTSYKNINIPIYIIWVYLIPKYYHRVMYSFVLLTFWLDEATTGCIQQHDVK